MSRVILPVLFFIITVGLFFTYIDPAYKKMQELQALDTRLDGALTKSREFQEARDALLAKYESFNLDDIDRLQTLLPDSLDNVNLTLGVDTIAQAHNIALSDFEFRAENAMPSNAEVDSTVASHRSALLSFSAVGTYADFVNFLRDLEKSLRVVDTHRITVDIVRFDDSRAQERTYVYQVALRSHWLE